MKIGVLALQGDFHRTPGHAASGLGAEAVQVRLPEHLAGLDGLIIPGGESTTIGKLAVAYSLMEPLRHLGASRPSGAPAPGRSFSPRMPRDPSRCWG